MEARREIFEDQRDESHLKKNPVSPQHDEKGLLLIGPNEAWANIDSNSI